MSTFAIVNNGEVIPAVNYLLSNLDTTGNANVTIPGNVLVANTATGVVSQYGNTSVFAYLYQYVNLRYSNNSTGTAGFDTNSNNYAYFGVFNSASPTPSANPVAYQWYEVSPPFDTATSRTLYYSAIGGRQIQWAAASSPPSSGFQITTANVAIDLDVVTTATGTPGERGAIAMAYVITTADPTTALSATLTGWWEASRTATVPPIGTGLTPVAGDTAFFTYPTTGASATFTYNGSVWTTAVGQVVAGNVLVSNTVSGSSLVNSTVTGTKIANATITGSLIVNDTITGNLIAASTITGNLIAGSTITGNLIAGSTITGNLIAGSTITGNLIAGSTITGNLIAGSTITANNITTGTLTTNLFTANTINGNILTAGTVTANLINANGLIVNTVVSTGATIGNISSSGFWLQGNTGNARFGSTVSIGNNLVVGNNAQIGGNLNVSGLVTTGSLNSNTVITNTVVPGSITTTPIIVSTGANYPGAGITSGVPFFLTAGQAVTYTSNDFVFVLNSSYSIQFSGGTGTGTLVDVDMIRTPGGAAGIWTALGRVSWTPASAGYLNLSSAGLTETFNQGLVAGQTYSYRPQITLTGTIPTNLNVFVYWTIQVLKR